MWEAARSKARGQPRPLRLCVMALGAVLTLATAPVVWAESDPIASHFERGQAYLDKGQYALAVLEFEQVLKFDNLPPDFHQQAKIYAQAARDYKKGNPLSGFGYVETGGGYYLENVTRSTNAARNTAASLPRARACLSPAALCAIRALPSPPTFTPTIKQP